MLYTNPNKCDTPFFFESIQQFSKRQLRNIQKHWSSEECICFGENCNISLNATVTHRNPNSILWGPNKDDWKAFVLTQLSNSSSNFIVPMLPNMDTDSNDLVVEGFALKPKVLAEKEPFIILYDPNINLNKFFRRIMDSIITDYEKSGLTKVEYPKEKNHTMIFLNLNMEIEESENWLAVCCSYNIHFVMTANSLKETEDISKYIFPNCGWCVAYSTIFGIIAFGQLDL